MAAPRVPLTLLHGFLGAGKTTMLRHWLHNREGQRLGVVVNDMAEVNVDAELVRSTEEADPTLLVELENGCACCSLGDDLLSSLEHLMKLDPAPERIIVECSGVAEPTNTKRKLAVAREAEYEVMGQVELGAMVTVVDASTFMGDFGSAEPLAQRSDLGEWVPGDLELWGGNRRRAVSLLLDQVEVADVLVLNKADTVSEAALLHMQALLHKLNPTAAIRVTRWGQLVLADLPRTATGSTACAYTDDTDGAIAAYTPAPPPPLGAPPAPAPAFLAAAAGRRPVSASLGELACSACAERTAAAGSSRSFPACPHVQTGAPPPGAASTAGGLTLSHVVYRARRPFHPERLRRALRGLPVKASAGAGAAVAANAGDGAGAAEVLCVLNAAAGEGTRRGLAGDEGDGTSPLQAVLRSKGFVWLAVPALHCQRYYWSHAGCTFELAALGGWWASLHKSEWPTDERARLSVVASMQPDTGDRRQEIVFIGSMGALNEDAIYAELDQALVSEHELGQYYAQLRGYSDASTCGGTNERELDTEQHPVLKQAACTGAPDDDDADQQGTAKRLRVISPFFK